MVASTDGKPGFFTTDDAYIVRFELQVRASTYVCVNV
jgi:hypothetical protein